MGVQAMPTSGDAHATAGRLRRFWDSSVGKKSVMAVTGVIGIAFVIGHMVGNLQMFKPTGAPQAMHDYAVMLRNFGPLLWTVRAVLLLAVILHVVAAYQLTMRARAARPVAYRDRKPQVSTLSSRSMRVGGFLLLVFIVLHILDMTWGVGLAGFRHLDPYNNLRLGMGRTWVAVLYVVAMALLGLHLFHGAWSFVRSLGMQRQSRRPLHRTVAAALAVLIALGFAAVPIAALLGVFDDDTPVIMDDASHAARWQAPGEGVHMPAAALAAALPETE